MMLLEELRAEIVELAEAVHDMRGNPSVSWQQDMPETAALVKRLDEEIAAHGALQRFGRD